MKYQPYPKRDPIKNYFPLPNEIFMLGLGAGEISVYSYLLYLENRKTFQCWPSYKTIGKAVDMGRNTVRKYVLSLKEKRLITTGTPARRQAFRSQTPAVLAALRRRCADSFGGTERGSKLSGRAGFAVRPRRKPENTGLWLGSLPGKGDIMAEKVKFAFYMTQEKKQELEQRFREDGSRSMTAFVENAVDFYLDYLHMENAGALLPKSITSAIDGSSPMTFSNRSCCTSTSRKAKAGTSWCKRHGKLCWN